MEWKPLGKGINVGKTSSPFSTQATMGGGGGSGSLPGYSIPRASKTIGAASMYTGPARAGTGGPRTRAQVEMSPPKPKEPRPNTQPARNQSTMIGRMTNQAKKQTAIRRIKNEVLSDYEKARNRYDPEASARKAGFASRADWAKAVKGETNAEKSSFYDKKRKLD